ncbi:MAG TPA: hypothetical protein VGJ04_06255, partial [Pirellulales bacterium]
MSDLAFVVSKAMDRDGIEYTISVYQSYAGLAAFWECTKCANQDGPSMPVLDRDDAIEKCRVLIEQHHAQH